MPTLAHRPVWIDLATLSGGDIASFYSEVCGWSAAEGSEQFGGYFMFFHDDTPVSGAMPTPAGEPGGWTTYIQVADLDATLTSVTAHGGTVVAGPLPIADLGSMAVILDQAGCPLGLWSPDTFSGFPLDGRVGAPVWFELYTKDYRGSISFLSAVFGWQFDAMSDTDDFRYSTVSLEGEQILGIMDFSADMHAAMPAYWNNYFRVENCDAAAEAATTNGGSLLMSPTDTPFGRMSSIRDRDGAIFSVIQMNAAE